MKRLPGPLVRWVSLAVHEYGARPRDHAVGLLYAHVIVAAGRERFAIGVSQSNFPPVRIPE